MGSVNKVILIGHVGADPEVKNLSGDKKVANLNLATSESYKDKDSGEKKTITDWHKLSIWKGLAGVVEKYVKKGSKIYVEGKLKHKSYENADGEKKYFTEVQVTNLVLLGGKSESTNQRSENNNAFESDQNEDLPF